MFDLILKSATKVFGASLVLILIAKLVSACTIVEGSTIIEDNKFTTQVFFGLTLALAATTFALFFLNNKRGIIIIILCSIFVFLQPAWRFGGGGGDCGDSFVQFSKYLFGLSFFCFIYQIALWIIKLKKSEINLK